jgi:membrane protein DedA with SNARE-associated domain
MEYFDLISELFSAYPYLVVAFGFILILFLFPIPEELILFVGGFMARQSPHREMWMPTLIVGIIGVVATDYWFYIWAKLYGRKLFKIKIVNRVISDRKRRRALKLVRKYGARAIFAVRFIPGGIRNPTYLACGLSNMPQKKFIITDIIAACIGVHISFWAGYFFSEHLPPIQDLVNSVQKRSFLIIVLIILSLIAVYFIGKALDRKMEGPEALK